MERGRSPSAGLPAHIRHSASASPHPPLPHDSSLNHSFDSNAFNQVNTSHQSATFSDPSFTTDYQQQASAQFASLGATYEEFAAQEHMQSQPQNQYLQTQGNLDYNAGSQPGSNHVSPGALSSHSSPPGESTAFPSFENNQFGFDQNGSLDPSFLDFTSSDNSTDLGLSGTSINPMATMQSHSPTPPHLLQPNLGRRQSNSPSPQTSPAFQQSFQGANRPRNASESLDPMSAMFPQGQNEWANMGVYRHNRSPSDAHSEYSSHSNQASPYLGNLDSFDAPGAHSSPMLPAQQNSEYNSGLGLDRFSLNEPHQHNSFHSPGHSPHHSPRMMPDQQPLPGFTAADNYGLQYNSQPHHLEMFPNAVDEPFPSLNAAGSPRDLGAADQMSPPVINIDLAEPSTVMNDVPKGVKAEDTLSPPLRTQSRARTRAKSDSYAGPRSSKPPVPSRGRSPSLQPQQSFEGKDSLMPFNGDGPPSRSPSPTRGRNGSVGNRARSLSNQSDQREYLLDLANPERTPSSDGRGRVQKHPATFKCHLCTKRFTRAYNLRSHLRTHTDERPFVCTVCGKAFARQHDRKRHEGLHSGEKKFVCRGTLQSNSQWGCGRRFARADALGRHFRSEAGRVCIKPLLDEEAAERDRAWVEEQQQAQVAAGFVAPQPMVGQPQSVDMMGNFLPAALLQQYPALAGLDWNAMPQGAPPDEEAYSGRSSFDASSGGEFYDDMSENEMGNAYHDHSGMGNMGGMGMGGQGLGNMQHGMGGGGVYGQQQATGDYLSGFEGR
ncbi:hypothetical protein K431DRAFT_283857 [Polychaeton citri CBS 116435]|uniref:C2H2-type domain-containing protein n=1 Tax=Polychaeton citri CBS 116435 TaxID=1314669 RepID=A0A9P4QCM6_9PEZI|nr:hypothetical protein K431DRAFT_283857 [Polychaeton citri CBS 116435]